MTRYCYNYSIFCWTNHIQISDSYYYRVVNAIFNKFSFPFYGAQKAIKIANLTSVVKVVKFLQFAVSKIFRK